MVRLNKNSIVYYFGMFLIPFSLIMCYSNFLVEIPFYKDNYTNQFTPNSFYLGMLLYICFSIFLYKVISKFQDFSSLIIFFLFLLSFPATTVLFMYSDITSSFFFLYIVYWGIIFTFFFIIKVKPFRERKRLVYHRRSYKYILLILMVLCGGFVIALSYRVYGKINLLTSFDNVYDARESADVLGTIPNMISGWIGYVILPWIGLKSLKNKNFFLFLCVVFLILISFSIAGMKTQIFILPAIIFVRKMKKLNKISWIPFFVSLLIISGVIEYTFFSSFYILDFIVTRLFFIPALLNFKYFSFFLENAYLFVSENIFVERFLFKILGFQRVYPNSIASIIGSTYAVGGSHANTGLIGYAYADMGLAGVLLSPIIMIVLLKFQNEMIRKNDCAKYVFLVTSSLFLLSVSISEYVFQIMIPLSFVCYLERRSFHDN